MERIRRLPVMLAGSVKEIGKGWGAGGVEGGFSWYAGI
jgi:hypothetical protein